MKTERETTRGSPMSAETTPAELVDILRGEIGAAMDVTEDGTAMSVPNFEPAVEDVVQAVIRVLADRSTRPAEPAALTVDTIAAFLHKEVEWPEDNYPAYAWPEVDGDTGQRDGGYVKIVPKYVVEEFRGIARRLLIAFRQEGVVPTEPAAPVAEAGDGEIVGWFCLDLAAGGVKGFTFSESLAKQRDGYRYLGQLAWEVYPVVRLSALEAERARADELSQERDQALIQIKANIAAIDRAKEFVRAAEQRAADALARAEKAERERDAYHDALTPDGDTKALMIGEFFEEIEVRNPDYDGESLDEDEDDEPEFITHRVPVSWTTTKAMMKRLRSYAHRLAASREAQPATDGGDNG